MSTKELVAAVAAATEKSEKEVKEILTVASEMIAARVLEESEDVTFMDLGTFKPKVREARTGRNPKTGEAVKIPESHSIQFKVSRKYKVKGE